MTEIPYMDDIYGTTVKVLKIAASLVRPISDSFSFAMMAKDRLLQFCETDFIIGNCSNYLTCMTGRGFLSTLASNCAGTTNDTRRQDLLSQYGPARRVSAVHI